MKKPATSGSNMRQHAGNRPPNVVIVITDDQGYGDLGCHGNPFARTPNLDELHDESVRFVDFHAAPMCTPTRGQLMTGLDAARNGALNVSSGRSLLRADLPTMADSFHSAGYSTGVFGKWHLGDNYPYRPHDRGFDEAIWFPSSHISSLPDYWQNDLFDDVYFHKGERKRVEGYCTEVFFTKAIEWMDEQIVANRPFFAYLPTNAPHHPLFVPSQDREYMEKVFEESAAELPELPEKTRTSIIRFLAMIRNLDTQVGRLRRFLSERQVAQDTIFIFMTDNGSTFGPIYYNAGMRGQKTELWEGGHRVPCFVHWPGGGIGEPRDVGGLTETQDVLPTLCDLCGISHAGGDELDGMSLAPVLRGRAGVPDERMLVVNYSRMPGELDFPTPDSPSVMKREGSVVLWKRWRLIERAELYDLEHDPGQREDVASRHPDIVEKLAHHLDTWWEDVAPTANAFQRVTVGNDAENPAMLSACEWADVFVDLQRQVRRGVRKNSYWHLNVDRRGTYTFELRRWPRESKLRLRDSCPPAKLTDGELDGGISLPISRARIFLGGQRYETTVPPDASAAVFTVQLEAGPTLLHTWFDDKENEPICGAYYVYVTRI